MFAISPIHISYRTTNLTSLSFICRYQHYVDPDLLRPLNAAIVEVDLAHEIVVHGQSVGHTIAVEAEVVTRQNHRHRIVATAPSAQSVVVVIVVGFAVEIVAMIVMATEATVAIGTTIQRGRSALALNAINHNRNIDQRHAAHRQPKMGHQSQLNDQCR